MIYVSREAAEAALVEYLVGTPSASIIPCDNPIAGVLGFTAWDTVGGEEVSSLYAWPHTGTSPLTPTVVACTRLQDLSLTEGDFYPCDNPLQRVKGFVQYFWELGTSVVYQFTISAIKRLSGVDMVAFLVLESQASANWKRFNQPDAYERLSGLRVIAASRRLEMGGGSHSEEVRTV